MVGESSVFIEILYESWGIVMVEVFVAVYSANLQLSPLKPGEENSCI